METVADWLVSRASALLLIIVMGSWLASIRAESSLEEKIGMEWQLYLARVPMFIPHWKKKSKEKNY